MRDLLPFLVVGVTTGAVYALASMGLVLTYTTSGVFNFAHGAVGMFATYIFYVLRVEQGFPTPVAAAVAILVIGPLFGFLIDRVLLVRLEGASPAAYIVVSLGLLVALQGASVAIFGGETKRIDPLFSTTTFDVGDVAVGYDQVILVGIAVVVGIGLAVFFRRTSLGLQTRAVVGDRELTELVGINASAVTTFSWMVGCAFAALAGVLFAPFVGLDAVLLTLLVVQAFGAAIIGRLRNLGLTNIGAYGIAIAAAVSTKYAATNPTLVGLPSSIPFIVLFAVLVFSPKERFSEVLERGRSIAPTVGSRVPWTQIGLLAGAAALVPLILKGANLFTATVTVAYVLVFASLGLLVGLARQLSLTHAVFVVFGATNLSHLLSAGVPFVPALVLAALLLIPLGALIAIPAIRLSGLFLALATFGFGVLAQALLFNTGLSFGRDAVVTLHRPSGFEGDTAMFALVLTVVTAGVVLIELVRVGRLGRMLRALGDSEAGVQSVGVSPTASRVLVFSLSAFFAGLAGGLLGALIQVITPSTFDFFQSLLWVTVLVTAGAASLGGAVLAAILLVAAPAVLTSPGFVEWQPVGFGVAAIVFAQSTNGLIGYLRLPPLASLSGRRVWRLEGRRHQARVAALARSH